MKLSEVENHNSAQSCWVIVHGNVYDVSEFLPEHPGGQKIILKYAGKDATKKFDPIHPKDVLDKYLPQEKHLGAIEYDKEPATAAKPKVAQSQPQQPPQAQQSAQPQTPQSTAQPAPEPLDEEQEEERMRVANANKPPLSQIYNLFDFEHVARQVMSRVAWGYYSSGSDDEITMRENHRSFHRIWFRPRVLIDVKNVDTSTTFLGTKVSAPFYISATALGKLGCEEGEVALTKAAAREDVIQMIPTLASCSFDEIVDAATDQQTQWMQLYVNSDRKVTQGLVQHAERRGVKGLWITVDAPQLGRREKDMRSKYNLEASSVQDEEGDEDTIDRSQGAARAISSFIDTSLSWEDIPWFQSITKMPIALKGVQRAEDALKAVEYGVDAIVVSNHGGRQLEFSRPSIATLVEVMSALRQHNLHEKIEVYLDGGIRRATDIMKALCLGAKGVGLGRPFIYAMSAYGSAGAVRAIQLLKDELEMNMRLIGVTSLDQLNPSFLDVGSVNSQAVSSDILADGVYEPMSLPRFAAKL